MLENNTGLDPSREAERAEEREQVRAALEQMKPRSARLLVLRHSGLSYAELAETLKVAPSSIGTLLARAEMEFEEHYRRLEGE
jgi:RNA polymerase sigma-70 factor (ECF subfamily)